MFFFSTINKQTKRHFKNGASLNFIFLARQEVKCVKKKKKGEPGKF